MIGPDDVTVREIVLCATNEGRMYDVFCRAARREASAWTWATLVGDYLAIYRREQAGAGFRLTTAEHLMVAASLADYYADHLGEFGPDELARLDRPAT